MSNAFPFSINGVTFPTRAALENALEKLSKGPTAAHTQAAVDLIEEAKAARVLSTDQIQDIKKSLHL